jgi:formate/nitrite transporter FocA (FNT family)
MAPAGRFGGADGGRLTLGGETNLSRIRGLFIFCSILILKGVFQSKYSKKGNRENAIFAISFFNFLFTSSSFLGIISTSFFYLTIYSRKPQKWTSEIIHNWETPKMGNSKNGVLLTYKIVDRE